MATVHKERRVFLPCPPPRQQAGRQRGRQASPLSGDRACEIECVIREFVQLDRQLVLKFSYMFCP